MNNRDMFGKEQGKGAWGPAIGFVLMLIAATFAFLLYLPFKQFVAQRFNLGAQLRGDFMNWVFGLVLFIVFIMIFGLIYTVLIPKQKIQVRDAEMVKGRKELEKEKEEKRRRAAKVKHEMYMSSKKK
jgi:uncharacterized BrkB/YihY/UPF0761 family membrane protein